MKIGNSNLMYILLISSYQPVINNLKSYMVMQAHVTATRFRTAQFL